MARQNKELGRFQLTGIRRAMRGVPQIEVTFAIDANGIVNVSAKDLGTGRAQDITITATSNMSQADIDRAVREAQQYAQEDARTKAEATARDRCEQLIYQAGMAKVDRACKARLNDAVKEAKQAVKSKDTAAMDAAARNLESVLADLGCQAGPDDPYQAPPDDNVMDADFEQM